MSKLIFPNCLRVVPCTLLVASGFLAIAGAQVDENINKSIWKQKFGVLDAQMNEQPPYAGWLSQDADGDGINNRSEFVAGTNPFAKVPTEAHFRPPTVTANPTTLSLTFPTVPGKLYGAESNMSLVEAWSKGSLPSVVGDGTNKTLVVPKNAGKFFHVSVTDQATQGDQVSDWAKHMLGLSPSAPITSQTSFDSNSLAASLETQNIVSINAVDTVATQPAGGSAPSGDYGVIRVTRSGFMMLGAATVPLTKSGTAVEGIDIAPLPTSLTFPAGVNSLDVRVTPLFNASRTSPATAFLTVATPGSAGSGGNYTLGSPTSAGVTVYPSGDPAGTGLTASYHAGVVASYSYTKINTTSGTAVVTYSGSPTTPYTIGSQVTLQFTSGNLGVSAYNYPINYTITALPTASSFSVAIAGTVPSTGTGSLIIAFAGTPVVRVDPTVDVNWGYGSPNGTTYVGQDNYSVTWEGWLSPTATGNFVFRLDAYPDDKAIVEIDTGSGYQTVVENGWVTEATGVYKSSAPIALTLPAAAANRYPIRVKFVETTGSAKCKLQWQPPGGSFANIPSASIWKDNTSTTANTTNNVWNALYYNNTTHTEPFVRSQTDAASMNSSTGDWLTGSPDPSINHNYFTARWTGQILPQYSQPYYFVGRVDDGLKLWVNNQLVINRWPGSGVTDSTSTGIDLQAGVLYDIKMEYYEATGLAEAHLSWYSEDQAKQIIPMNRLFPTTTGRPAITSPTSVVTILGSGLPFTTTLASSNGGTITASGLPLWLTLDNGVLSGYPPTAGIYQFTVTTTNAAGSGSAILTLEVLDPANQLTRDVWTSGVTGAELDKVPWTTPPSSSDTVPLAEDTTPYPENTGERLRGYFTAPTTGNYYFWIAASNVAELWISNDSEPVNKVRRAHVTGCPPSTWNAQPSQKSRWLSLVAGKKYYMEALHNTGASVIPSHLSVAWFFDPTGNTANPVANGSGVIPSHVLSPWDNPPTTTIPGNLYVTGLQGAEGLSGITGTGGAFLRVNGTTAVLQLNYTGLTSGAISRRIYNSSGGVLFDLNAQEKNYPTLKTSDGGYTWNMQASDLTALNNGDVYVGISTVNHPTGELAGTFGKIAGSQPPPPVPTYPLWADLHATSDAANSRFLTQATFGPSPSDMTYVKNNGYQTWINTQMDKVVTPVTKNVPYILENLSSDPGTPYGRDLIFNSWWKNSITAKDQLRQRAAFALSEILVVSNVGPLDSNPRVLADYYDTLLDSCFGNFRDILKQVTLSPAMGVYLDMRGNTKGDIATGQHPNENYAREILQLFSAGLYRTWPDGTLVLDSSGNPVATYTQDEITGFARVFTGWNWGQSLLGTGRLPTNFGPTANYLDPMVLVSARHELGSKILLDNVVLPPATNTDSATSLTDPNSITIQTTDPIAGQGNLVSTAISNQYDLNGLKDLEATLDNIMENSAVGPHICRQLIQRLVTSQPKPEYVQRVVRAFNGEQYAAPSNATGVRGDMKEVFRAILLDAEARDPAATNDVKFGKQREPVLRITGPARSLPALDIPNSTYAQSGLGTITVTTPTPHRLFSGQIVRLADFVPDQNSPSTQLPTTQQYTVSNVAPTSFTVNNSGTSSTTYSVTGNVATINSAGYAVGDRIYLNFTTGGLSGGAFAYNKAYTVETATSAAFTVDLGSPPGDTSGACLIPKITSGYTVNGIAGAQTILIQTTGNHNLVGYKAAVGADPAVPGDLVYLKFAMLNSPVGASNGIYEVTSVVGANSFKVAVPAIPVLTTGSQDTSSVTVFPLKGSQWTRNGTVTVGFSNWNIGTPSSINQNPLNSPTVFNFFYPDYQYPGDIANAGMTTPEFQLTNDSNTMNLTNTITGGTLVNFSSTGVGYFHFFSNYALTMDYSPYMTPAKTSNAGIPALVDELGILLTSGNLTSGTKTIISNYVTSTNPVNFAYTTPTTAEMRNRVSAIVHLIVTSAEYAIQK